MNRSASSHSEQADEAHFRVERSETAQGVLSGILGIKIRPQALLTPTTKGRSAIKKIAREQAAFSSRIVTAFGKGELQHFIAELHWLSAVIEET